MEIGRVCIKKKRAICIKISKENVCRRNLGKKKTKNEAEDMTESNERDMRWVGEQKYKYIFAYKCNINK